MMGNKLEEWSSMGLDLAKTIDYSNKLKENWIMADRLWLAFKALSSGKLIIVFGYRRSWEKE